MFSLRSLHHFVVLAQRLNYSRSAEELGITQPTLSRSIQSLEQQLGTKLFDRDRGGVSLTTAGVYTAERAGHLLSDAEDLHRHSLLSGQGRAGRIRFGMTPMPAHALLHQVLSERLTSSPDVVHEVVVRDADALWAMLLAGQIEFFASADRPPHDLSPARVDHLAKFPVSLLVRADHPLTRCATSDQKFPLLRSAWAGIAIPSEIQPLVLGEPNIIEDYGVLEKLTESTDSVWLSCAHAVRDAVLTGRLIEIRRVEHSVDLLQFSLRRRSMSPLACAVSTELRQKTSILTASQMPLGAIKEQQGRF